MSDIFSKFNVYDQIGYLLVGSVAIMVGYADFHMLGIKFPDLNFTNMPAWIIIGYFLGHLIQALANVFIKEKKENFSQKDTVILDKARKCFDAEKATDGEVWNLCYMLASAKDITGQVQSFNSYYSLYRGWLIVFATESVFLLIYMIASFSYLTLVLLSLSTGISLLFFRRLRRFYKYTRSKVLQTFVLLTILEKNTNI